MPRAELEMKAPPYKIDFIDESTLDDRARKGKRV